MGYGKSLKAAIISASAILGACTASHAQEIKFWTLSFDSPNMAKTFQTIIEDFEAANPGVAVKLENRGTDEHMSALRVAGGSDQAPDIHVGGLGLDGEFAKSGLALPMDKYDTHYKCDGSFSLKV
ncbi:MAG TPA: extracellular solute-binding protein [Roseiarcus sp.]